MTAVIKANYRGTLHDDVTRFIHRPREYRVGDFYILRRTQMHANCAKKFVPCFLLYPRFSITFISRES